jgi:hypothetical protein
MPLQNASGEVRLTGHYQKRLRQWLALNLPQFAAMTTESTATHSRREQQNTPLAGSTAALVLVLDYLYELRGGKEHDKIEQLRQQLATDPTRRHFLGRFGAGGLLQMIQEAGLPLHPLLDRVQAWCEQDLQQQVERTATTQLQQTAGLRNFAIGGLVGAALAGLSWAWLQQVFTSPKTKSKKGESRSDRRALNDTH